MSYLKWIFLFWVAFNQISTLKIDYWKSVSHTLVCIGCSIDDNTIPPSCLVFPVQVLEYLKIFETWDNFLHEFLFDYNIRISQLILKSFQKTPVIRPKPMCWDINKIIFKFEWDQSLRFLFVYKMYSHLVSLRWTFNYETHFLTKFKMNKTKYELNSADINILYQKVPLLSLKRQN